MSKELRFLIVDDFSTMRRIVRNLLKESGYADADEAEDGVIALQKLRNSSFDFVVSDINMPNMGGIELIKKARALPGFRFLPILTLTTESQQSRRDEGKQAGATGWLVKPVGGADLLKVIKQVLPGA